MSRFLREIRSPEGKEEDFSQNRPGGLILQGRAARKYLRF